MTTSKAFQDALNEEEPVKTTTPEVVIEQDTGNIVSKVSYHDWYSFKKNSIIQVFISRSITQFLILYLRKYL